MWKEMLLFWSAGSDVSFSSDFMKSSSVARTCHCLTNCLIRNSYSLLYWFLLESKIFRSLKEKRLTLIRSFHDTTLVADVVCLSQWVRKLAIPRWCDASTSSVSSCSTRASSSPPTPARPCSTSTSWGTLQRWAHFLWGVWPPAPLRCLWNAALTHCFLTARVCVFPGTRRTAREKICSCAVSVSWSSRAGRWVCHTQMINRLFGPFLDRMWVSDWLFLPYSLTCC